MFKLKNQGQSTTEYLLVVGLATFFVLVLAAQMNPRFFSMLGNLEDVVASKIAGGKLISHYKVGQLPEGVGTKGGAPEASSPSASSGGEGGGAEVSQGGTLVAQGGRAERGEPSFLGSSASSTTVAKGEGGTSSQPETSSGINVVIGSQGQGETTSKPVPQEGQKSSGSEKATEEKAGDSKGKGLMYTEGEEEGVVARKGFDWMKIIMLLLIIILIIYVAFEIFKAVKVNKSK